MSEGMKTYLVTPKSVLILSMHSVTLNSVIQ